MGIKVVALKMGMMVGGPSLCDRTQVLEERDASRALRNEYDRCHKINTRPGFGTIAKMRINSKGGV
jgi:hypothetical protein